jgi:hypothetical protein
MSDLTHFALLAVCRLVQFAASVAVVGVPAYVVVVVLIHLGLL